MTIEVKFFASLREQIGRSEARLDASEPLCVAEVWAQATGNAELPVNVLMARNMEYVDSATPVRDGDEVAFFPPVTGG
ncbi:MoaD/ThiS family protein [Thiohalophilus sp.]|uniref:MoaD/ThiS family protein n=1 Tax=Thiohalophilus sp. TaxID=3028392 RepID=UPI003974EB22